MQLPEKSQRDNFPIDEAFTKKVFPTEKTYSNGLETVDQDDCPWQKHKKTFEKCQNECDDVKAQQPVSNLSKNFDNVINYSQWFKEYK